MDIEIVVIGESSKWVLSHSRVRIGQDSRCEVNLPPGRYPAVSAEHVALEQVNGSVILVKDDQARGETFLNGHPASDGALVRSGDILRLGAGGPELRIRLLEREAYTLPAEREPTRVIAQPAATTHDPTRVIHAPTRIVSSPAATVYSAAPPASGSVARPDYSAPAQQESFATPPPKSAANQSAANQGVNMRSLEDKLKSMQNILLMNLVLTVVLLGCLVWQQRELSQNRDDVRQLNAQTQNAVGQFTPALDLRLKALDDRLDGMDAKVADAQDRLVKGMDAQTKRAEDHMVDRMNTAIPAMLDKYVADKFAVLKH
jgi:hypothetical protein